ncbi:MAG: TIGR01906 family membrane protein [Coprococcus sp.]
MAKKKWLHKILAILPSISLIVILLISSFEIGAYGDWNFYEKEYEKYKVADELYMEMPDIMKVTKFMMSYLRGNEKKLSIETEVEGNIQDFFNEKDRLHMADVQGLFLADLQSGGGDHRTAFSMAVLVLMKADWKRLIPQMYQRVLAVFLALTAVAGFLFSRDFNKYFVIFHHIFFNNNLWILDPAEDYMIRMLPEGFFYDMVMRIGSIFAVFLIVSFVCSIVQKKINKRCGSR